MRVRLRTPAPQVRERRSRSRCRSLRPSGGSHTIRSCAMAGTILIAEDEALSRKNICQVLAQEGYQVHQAADGKEAIEAVDTMDFDLVLTDIQMPGADGLAVLKHVREVAPQTFVTIMTAYASVDTAVAALQLGAQDYLLKPIVFDDLLRKIRLLLEHK